MDLGDESNGKGSTHGANMTTIPTLDQKVFKLNFIRLRSIQKN